MNNLRKILIIKDYSSNLQPFRDVLQVHGFKVIDLKKPNQAMDLVNKYSPDLIILGIEQSECPNLKMAKELKQNRALKNISIIGVSPLSMPIQEGIALEAGCDRYLSKPFSIGTFLNTVHALLEERTL